MTAVPIKFDRHYRCRIQMALNEHTKSFLKIDGDFGPKSVAVLRQYQQQCKLPVTGVYDDATQKLLGPFIATKYLMEQDFIDAAKALSCEIAAVKTVVQVEAGGDGFLPSGDCDILFERHHFRRYLIKAYPLASVNVMQQQFPGIISGSPGGYQGGQKEWERFTLALSLDKEAAMLSTSWGMFQIMGFNHKTAGYETVQAFVEAMQKSEKNHLKAFVSFIKADPRLARAIIRKDWASFAEAYNGPSYAKNKYDVKMAQAYKALVG